MVLGFRGFRVLWLRVLGLRFRGSGVQGFRVEGLRFRGLHEYQQFS